MCSAWVEILPLIQVKVSITRTTTLTLTMTVRFTKTSGTFVEMSNDVVRAKLGPIACQSENRSVSISRARIA